MCQHGSRLLISTSSLPAYPLTNIDRAAVVLAWRNVMVKWNSSRLVTFPWTVSSHKHQAQHPTLRPDFAWDIWYLEKHLVTLMTNQLCVSPSSAAKQIKNIFKGLKSGELQVDPLMASDLYVFALPRCCEAPRPAWFHSLTVNLWASSPWSWEAGRCESALRGKVNALRWDFCLRQVKTLWFQFELLSCFFFFFWGALREPACVISQMHVPC